MKLPNFNMFCSMMWVRKRLGNGSIVRFDTPQFSVTSTNSRDQNVSVEKKRHSPSQLLLSSVQLFSETWYIDVWITSVQVWWLNLHKIWRCPMTSPHLMEVTEKCRKKSTILAASGLPKCTKIRVLKCAVVVRDRLGLGNWIISFVLFTIDCSSLL